MAHAEDLKKQTIEPVLKMLVEELKRLHDYGFDVQIDMTQENFRCFLTQVVGDNLGLHAVLGYLENFSRATYACDLCMATQEDMQHVFSEKKLTLRTREMYNTQISLLNVGSITSTDCGIKRETVLSLLPYYHPACNDSVDIMHDLFEGVLPFETKLPLYHLIYEIKCIPLLDLNDRIKAGDYGKSNSKSRPSTISESHFKRADSALGQRSSQMFVLFMYLPLILSDILKNADQNKLHLYYLMRRILEVVMLPQLSTSDFMYIDDLVIEHHELFKISYPEKKLIYKHHRMVHYARLVKQSGPLLRMMVMRFEAKHNFFKRLAHTICNFKNITLSVSKRHQMAQALYWSTRSPLKEAAEVSDGVMVLVNELNDYNLLRNFTGDNVDTLAVSKVIRYGQVYETNSTVLLNINSDGEPVFALIDCLYVNEDVFFVSKNG